VVLRLRSPATVRIRTADGNVTAVYQASNQVRSQKLPITFVMSVPLSVRHHISALIPLDEFP